MPGDDECALHVESGLDRTGLAGLDAVEVKVLEAGGLAVIARETVAADFARASERRSLDTPLQTDSRLALVGRFERGLEVAGRDRVVAAHHLGGRIAHFPVIANGHRLFRQQIGKRDRITHALHQFQLGPGKRPRRTEDHDGPAALALFGDEQRHLRAQHRGRGANLAVDRRRCLNDVPDELQRTPRIRSIWRGASLSCRLYQPVRPDWDDPLMHDEPGLNLELTRLGHLGAVGSATRRHTRPVETLGFELNLNARRAPGADKLAQVDCLVCLTRARNRRYGSHAPEHLLPKRQ